MSPLATSPRKNLAINLRPQQPWVWMPDQEVNQKLLENLSYPRGPRNSVATIAPPRSQCRGGRSLYAVYTLLDQLLGARAFIVIGLAVAGCTNSIAAVRAAFTTVGASCGKHTTS